MPGRSYPLALLLIAMALLLLITSPSFAEQETDEAPSAKETTTLDLGSLFEGLIGQTNQPSAPEVGEPLTWHEDFQQALVSAQNTRSPVLVKFGASWCGWCKQLDNELRKPSAREAAEEWVRVKIDVDKNPELARRMKVSGVPALRALAPRGVVVGTQDGFMNAEPLATWLKLQNKAALDWRSVEEIYGQGKPNHYQCKLLIDALSQRDPAIREVAIARLARYSAATREVTIETLQAPRLIAQLCALEVLRTWNAPIEGLDPWQPATMTKERLTTLRDWAKEQPNDAVDVAEEELTDQRREEAQQLIERLVSAQGNSESLLARLRRYGPGLLPLVRQRHANAETDQQRALLGTLRYWLVADTQRVLEWPAGLRALASSDLPRRRSATEALVKSATSEDQALLLELFGDSDSFVREIALRGLAAAGPQATAALATLLEDPEPNVRAAVLKVLTESKATDMVPQVAAYLEQEQDTDLVVHAVRYLRITELQEATQTLLRLTNHPSWQVRAETAEAISEIAGNSLDDYERHVQEEVRQALYDLLEDEDAFVVSRALLGVSKLDDLSAEKIATVIGLHPSLATTAIEILVEADDAEKYIVDYTRHEMAEVRIAALTMAQRSPHGKRGELLVAALEDKESTVRAQAAELIFAVCNQNMPSFHPQRRDDPFGNATYHEAQPSIIGSLFRAFLGGRIANQSDPNEDAAVTEVEVVVEKEPQEDTEAATAATSTETNQEQKENAQAEQSKPAAPSPAELAAKRHREWVAKFREGKGRFAWLDQTVEPLRRLLDSGEPAEQLPAAMALFALVEEEAVLDFIKQKSDTDSQLVLSVLPWLESEQRVAWTRQLLLQHKDNQNYVKQLLEWAGRVPDTALIALLWELVETDPAKAELWSVDLAYHRLFQAYFGQEWLDSDELPSDLSDSVAEEMENRLQQPKSDSERVVALAILLAARPERIEQWSERIVADPETSQRLRESTLQIGVIGTGTRKQANRLALEILTAPDQTTPVKHMALRVLAFGESTLASLPTFGISNLQMEFQDIYAYPEAGKIIVPKPPAGLTADMLKPLVTDEEREIAALAAYFLTLLDRLEHLPTLMEYWRNGAHDSYQTPWRKLVYRAVAYADAEQWIGELEKIYQEHYAEGNDEIREFYWTIRMLSSDRAVLFRKTIRQQVGMDTLR